MAATLERPSRARRRRTSPSLSAVQLSPEARLLMLTARGADAPDAPARRVIDGGVDWAKLAFLAQQEGATCVLWQWLRRAVLDRVPRHIAAHWQRLAMVSEFQQLQLERALHSALDLLAAHGIDALPLKGSALAYTAYGSFAERPMTDLDVLVPPAHAMEAWTLLRAHGWTWPSLRWPAEHYTAHQHLPPLVATSQQGEAARIEIHTALLPGGHPFHWPVEQVWARAQRIPVRGRSVLVPDPLHQLLHVCVHFAWSHEMRWGSWRALRDVDVLAERGGIDWKKFAGIARQSRAGSCSYWTLRLARTLTGARIPDDVLRTLRPPRPETVLRRLAQHYMLQLFSTENGCPSEALAQALWDIGIAPRWSGHGRARPWQVSEQWGGGEVAEGLAAGQRAARTEGQLRQRVRNALAAVGYLGRLTASRVTA